ncbi:MAG: aminotransferase class III-fold pyridoxal phosphate-dependent enzyme [Deltaproteobacteria bacterium]|nr:aminotransferase class III-fold pyridoxal phosphate-dependent enzyme [Deltaproteobacteria bacterium]
MEYQRKVVALVQARMGSTRLPGKVLADIDGEPMLARIVSRVERSSLVTAVVVITSDTPADDVIEEFCKKRGLSVFRGSENDVLDRTYQAAKAQQAEAIVRVTADCPLIDPAVIDRVVAAYLTDDCDYASNTLIYTYPDGLDTEVFSFDALEISWREARRAADREHVTPYLRASGRFRLRNVECELIRSLRHYRWTVDEPCDLEFVRAVYARLRSKSNSGWREVLSLLDADPALAQLNSGFIRNEGYYHSLAREPAVIAQPRSIKRSLEIKAQAESLIPAATQTLSKGPTQYVQGVAPVFLARAKGSHVWDVDGNEYIDYPMALGPIILGHCYPAVDEAVKRQMEHGTAFSLPHPLEVEVAQRLVEMIPCAEMARFGKNGSDATAGAVRLARAYTGKELIACCGYHGWQDWYIGCTTFNRGVPVAVQQLIRTFQYNNIESLKRIFAEHPNQAAAVILEPVGVVEPQGEFLQQVRELTKREGCLLIFDEVITGFRLARGGAQEHFGVVPDLACFGKAMANGHPLSAVVGPREIMKVFEDVFFSFTFGGEALSLAAAQATMMEIAEKEVIAHLWEQGGRLKDGTNVLAREFGLERFVGCLGLPPRTVVSFFDESGRESLLIKSLFQQECLKRGVLFSGGHNLCFSHTASDIDTTLRVYRSALEFVARAIQDGRVRERLEGEPVRAVFRKA